MHLKELYKTCKKLRKLKLYFLSEKALPAVGWVGEMKKKKKKKEREKYYKANPKKWGNKQIKKGKKKIIRPSIIFGSYKTISAHTQDKNTCLLFCV